MAFPEWNDGATAESSSGRIAKVGLRDKNDKDRTKRTHDNAFEEPAEELTETQRLVEDALRSDPFPSHRETGADGSSASKSRFPTTFSDVAGGSPSLRILAARASPRHKPLTSGKKRHAFATKPPEVTTPVDQPLPPTPVSAHRLPTVRTGYALLSSVKRKGKETAHTTSFAPPRVSAVASLLDKSPQQAPRAPHLVTPAKLVPPLAPRSRYAMETPKAQREGASDESPHANNDSASTSRLRPPLPPQPASVKVRRFGTGAELTADLSSESPLKSTSRAIALRSASGNGLGPLVGGSEPRHPTAFRRRGEGEEAELDLDADARAGPSTPSKRQRTGPSHIPQTPGSRARSVLEIAANFSPDQLGTSNASRDRVVRDGLAARAAGVLKRERSEWVLWEHNVCVAPRTQAPLFPNAPAPVPAAAAAASGAGSRADVKAAPPIKGMRASDSTAQKSRLRPDCVLRVHRVLPPLRQSGTSQAALVLGARQILTICSDYAGGGTSAESAGAPPTTTTFPVLFSTSIMQFSIAGGHARGGGGGGANPFSNDAKAGSHTQKAITDVMRALGKLVQDSEAAAARQGGEASAPEGEQGKPVLVDIWNPTKLFLLADVQSGLPLAQPTASGMTGSSWSVDAGRPPALLCSRFKMHDDEQE